MERGVGGGCVCNECCVDGRGKGSGCFWPGELGMGLTAGWQRDGETPRRTRRTTVRSQASTELRLAGGLGREGRAMARSLEACPGAAGGRPLLCASARQSTPARLAPPTPRRCQEPLYLTLLASAVRFSRGGEGGCPHCASRCPVRAV